MWQLRSISIIDSSDNIVVGTGTNTLEGLIKFIHSSLKDTKGSEDYVYYITRVNNKGEADIDNMVKHLNELIKLEYRI